MKTRSITHRVVSIILLAELAAAAVLSVLVFFHEQHIRLRALDVSLQGRADSLLGAVQDAEDPGDNVSIDRNELRLPAEDRWGVFNPDGRPVGHSGESNDLAPFLSSRDGFRDEDFGGVRYRVLQHRALRIIDRAETGGVGIKRPVVLLYAVPETHLTGGALESASFYILAVVLVSAVTAAIVAVFLRLSLHPVAELGTAAERLSLRSLEFSPPPSVMSVTELRPLALTLSNVVARLREAFLREQRFVGDAAHELKTGVAVARSTIQVLMLRTRTPEEYRSGLKRILEDNQRLEALVQQMLSLARVDESGRSEPVQVDLAESVRETLAQLVSMSVHAGVEVLPSLAPGAIVAVPPDRARVLIVNLVLNAIQHSRREAQVSVSVSSELGTVALSVRDTGAGIPAEALPHIFERFYRADPSRARDTGGTGLGLAICKSIIDQAGATVEVVSELERGTTITVTFIKA